MCYIIDIYTRIYIDPVEGYTGAIKTLYGLIHARFILTNVGMDLMVSQIDDHSHSLHS